MKNSGYQNLGRTDKGALNFFFDSVGVESRVFQPNKSSTSEPRKLYLISAHCTYLINITLHSLYVKLIYGNQNKSSKKKTGDFDIPAKISDFYIPSLRHP